MRFEIESIRVLAVSPISGKYPDIVRDTKDHNTIFDRDTCPPSVGEDWLVISGTASLNCPLVWMGIKKQCGRLFTFLIPRFL